VSISIIIPCYSAATTLARTLESCVIQPEASQIIVVDDASTDNSAEIVLQYRQRDPRIELLTTPANGGSARARNWAALHASQDLLAFIDADDEYLPGALAMAQRFLQQAPGEASIRLDVEFVGFPARIVNHPDFERLAAVLSNTLPSSLVIRRPVYLALGGFPMHEFFRRVGGDDGALSWALSALFGNRRLIDAKRVLMHYHDGIHAERFFATCMGMQPRAEADLVESVRLSREFVVASQAAFDQLQALSFRRPPPPESAPPFAAPGSVPA
jgi:glycosyltransferase involved in cell wall biosynthesis